MLQGRSPLIATDTNYIYVHIADVQKAIVAASTMPSPKVCGKGYFIGSSEMTTRAFLHLLSKHMEVESATWAANTTMVRCLAHLLECFSWMTGREPWIVRDLHDTKRSIEYDCSRSVSELGMRYTPIDAAVRETVEDVKHRLAAPVSAPKDSPTGAILLPLLSLSVFLFAVVFFFCHLTTLHPSKDLLDG